MSREFRGTKKRREAKPVRALERGNLSPGVWRERFRRQTNREDL